MSKSPPSALALQILEQLQLLREILLREDEKNWIRGLDLCIEKLPNEIASDEERLVQLGDVAATYRSMTGGYGSFTDFHVWHDDFEERARLNRELYRVRSELWKLIDSIQVA